MDNDTKLALLDQEINFLKSKIETIEADVKEKFDRIEKKLDDALKGRPTWAVTIIISLLMTTCTGLGVAFLVR